MTTRPRQTNDVNPPTDPRRRVPLPGALAILCGLGLILLPACKTTPPQTLRRASTALNQRRAAHAEALAGQALTDSTRPDDRAAAYYLRALARLQQGRTDAARADLRAALAAKPENTIAGRCELQLGHIEFQRDNYSQAAELYQHAAEHLPPATTRDRALYQWGIALLRLGRFPQADATLRRLESEFPNSPLTRQARQKRLWGLDHFAVQCGAFNDPDRARALTNSLRKAGFPAAVRSAPKPLTPPYRVHCGPFATYAGAQQALDQIRRVQPDAFIIP